MVSIQRKPPLGLDPIRLKIQSMSKRAGGLYGGIQFSSSSAAVVQQAGLAAASVANPQADPAPATPTQEQPAKPVRSDSKAADTSTKATAGISAPVWVSLTPM
jgi:hypothetical protein